MNAIRHFFFETAFGIAAVTFSNAPFRLKEVCLPRPTKTDILANMKRDRRGVETAHPMADRIAAMIAGYFTGSRFSIPWDIMDTSDWTPSQAAVYRTVAQIPYGQVWSYGAVARLAGKPQAARFVGNCMAANPFPVFVPCHRVITSSGRLGGFGGGLDLKRKMLSLEGYPLDPAKS